MVSELIKNQSLGYLEGKVGLEEILYLFNIGNLLQN